MRLRCLGRVRSCTIEKYVDKSPGTLLVLYGLRVSRGRELRSTLSQLPAS